MKINYCLECAAPLTKDTDSHYTCQNGHDFWNNAKATVAVVVVRDNKVLVSKRGREPFKGQYDLPGGFVDYGEDPFQTAVRELDEETGLVINPESLRIITAYHSLYFENDSLCDIIMLAKDWRGEPEAQDDSEALAWQPFEFIDSDQFSPTYTGLSKLILDYV